MKMRNRIIELLENADTPYDAKEVETYEQMMHEFYGHIADGLISNGVVVQESAHWEWFEEWSPSTPEYPREVEDCGWRCSNCKTPLEDSVGGHWDDYTEKPGVKYCPECGAKIIGGKEDGKNS